MNFLSLERPRFPQNSLLAYAVAAVAVTVAAALHVIFARWFLGLGASGLPFVTFFPAVIVATFLCGSIPGLFAGFLSILLVWRLTSVPSNSPLLFLQTSLFSVGVLTVSAVIAIMRAASAQREQLLQELFRVQRLDGLGRLAAGIAHDINNRLVPVIALTDAVSKNLQPSSADVEALNVVRESANHIKVLVQQILAFSRSQKPHTMRIDPARFLQEALPFLRAGVPTTIDVAAKFDRVPAVLADPGQLRQVLINLVTNGVDAIGKNQGTITLSISEAPSVILNGKRCVEISVSDTGCGMDEQTLGKIFEPFFTTKEVNKGAGLGLSVVHGILAMHGGRIDVTSAVGSGTQFDVLIPIAAS